MPDSRIEAFGEVLMDLTNDTVTPDTLAKGVTAHDKTGTVITGTAVFGEGTGGPKMATGQISGYKSGELVISGLTFPPELVVVMFTASVKKKSTTFYSVATKSQAVKNTAQGFDSMNDSWEDYVYAYTEPAVAKFTDNSASWVLLKKDEGYALSALSWWAFGGVL